jgi:hypothetical protein
LVSADLVNGRPDVGLILATEALDGSGHRLQGFLPAVAIARRRLMRHVGLTGARHLSFDLVEKIYQIGAERLPFIGIPSVAGLVPIINRLGARHKKCPNTKLAGLSRELGENSPQTLQKQGK